ncbi:MAG: hypothetical protein ACK6EB_11765, partial [Planctomyces sp.]
GWGGCWPHATRRRNRGRVGAGRGGGGGGWGGGAVLVLIPVIACLWEAGGCGKSPGCCVVGCGRGCGGLSGFFCFLRFSLVVAGVCRLFVDFSPRF